MSFGACWEGLQRPPAAAGGAPAAPQQLTVPKDPLPELWREVAGGKVQVNSHQPEDVAPQQVPDLHVLLQSRVLQQLQQQCETLCNLRREKESRFTLRAVPMPKGSSEPEPPWLPLPSDTTRGRSDSFGGGVYPVGATAELAAEQEAGLLQQQVGIVAAAGVPQAGLCLLQEKLEIASVRRWAECPHPREAPRPPFQPYLGIAGALELAEQLGDLAQGAGHAQAVPKGAAQGVDQQVALHGFQGLQAGKHTPPSYTLRGTPGWGGPGKFLYLLPSSVTLAISL